MMLDRELERCRLVLTKHALLVVLELEVLIRELLAIDRLAARAIAASKVTTLNHKVLDDTVEVGALVSVALLASGQSTEVLNSLGNSLAVKTDDNATQLLLAMGHVEVDLVGNLGSLGSFGCLSEEDEDDGQDDHQGDGNPLERSHCEELKSMDHLKGMV